MLGLADDSERCAMYFDFLYYRKVLAYTWAQRQWPGRNRTLLKLIVLVPLQTFMHQLCFLLDYVFFPALWRQQVKTPVFIVGHARSGTTLMHRLMAADGERFSYFLYWETFFPALTEKAIVRGIAWLDRKLFSRVLQKRLEAWDEKTFGPWRHIHNQGLWIPEEDLFVMKAAFMPQQWALELPLMDEVDIFHIDELSEKRKRRWLHHYKECVKRQLLRSGGGKIHLSKNPVMSGWVSALLETFPDAKIVVMVRDPIQCIQSTLRLVEMTWETRKWGKKEYAGAQQALTDICFDCFKLPAEALAQHPNAPHFIVDYRDLVKAPKATIESAYEALQLPLTDDFSGFLTKQEEKEKKHSSHYTYDLNDYAVTAAEIESELDNFYQRYKWPRSNERTVSAGS